MWERGENNKIQKDMTIQLKWEYASGELDTKKMNLLCIRARGKRTMGPDEVDADLCIADGMNLCIANIHLGDAESSNALCEEICRRFNDFPEESKK